MRRTKYMTLLAGEPSPDWRWQDVPKAVAPRKAGRAGKSMSPVPALTATPSSSRLLSDYSGPFSPLATEVLEGAKAYWTEKKTLPAVFVDAYTVDWWSATTRSTYFRPSPPIRRSLRMSWPTNFSVYWPPPPFSLILKRNSPADAGELRRPRC